MAVLTTQLQPRLPNPLARVAAFATPGAAIVRREAGLLIQHRSFRIVVVGLTAVNLTIAYSNYLNGSWGAELPEIVRSTLLTQLATLAGIGFFVTAARAASSIGTERARNTWELLSLAPASPSSIALGYIGAALVPAAFMTISQLPILAIGFYAIGIEQWPGFATAALITIVSWVAAAAWGTWATVRFQRFAAAIIAATMCGLMVSGIVPAILFGMAFEIVRWASLTNAATSILLDTLETLSPLLQVFRILIEGKPPSDLLPHLAVMTVVTVLGAYLASRSFRRCAEPTLLTPRQRRAQRNRARAASDAWELSDRINPVFALERRLTATNRTWKRPVLFAAFALYTCWINFYLLQTRGWGSAEGSYVLLIVIALGIGAWTTAAGAAASKERQTFDLVAMTSLTNRELLRGKVLAGLVGVMPMVLLIAVCTATAARFTGETYVAAAIFVSCGACTATLVYGGLFACTVAPGTREAFIANVIVGIAMFIGIPILIGIAYATFRAAVDLDVLGLQQWFEPYSLNNSIIIDQIAAASSPLTGLMQFLDGQLSTEKWAAWLGSLAVAVAWSILWYWAANRALDRYRRGHNAWIGR